MNRHAMRGLVVQTLYHLEVGVSEKQDAIENIEWFVNHLKEKALENAELSLTNDVIEKEFTIEAYYHTTVDGIIENMEEIDCLLTENLDGWSIKRLNKVDKAILRLAIFEMLTSNTNHRIIINEAIELTKNFTDSGDKKAPNFNNRILDKVSQTIREKRG